MKKILIICFISSLFSCYNHNYSDDYKLINYTEKNIVKESILTDKSILIIIPLEGCDNCINPLVSYLNKNKKVPDKVRIVITSFYNKQIFQSFDKSFLDSDKVWIDNEGNVQRFVNIINTYPVIYFIRNKEISKKFNHNEENHNKIMELMEEF